MLRFYNADYCPFAQRVWLALEEKRVPYEQVIVNYFDRELPTTREFLAVSPEGMVPAGTYGVVSVFDSLPFNEWVEEQFPDPSLLPADRHRRFIARQAIKKHDESLVPAFYSLLTAADVPDAELHARLTALASALKRWNDDLTKHTGAGPYFFGADFSLVDCAIVPFIERIGALIPYYRGFDPLAGEQLAPLHAWYQACIERLSFKATSGTRSQQSMDALPFGAADRADFLREVYFAFAMNQVAEARARLAHAPPGKSSLVLVAAGREWDWRSVASPAAG
jgi:glutathione S-transferase